MGARMRLHYVAYQKNFFFAFEGSRCEMRELATCALIPKCHGERLIIRGFQAQRLDYLPDILYGNKLDFAFVFLARLHVFGG